jgi:hypothetical protein
MDEIKERVIKNEVKTEMLEKTVLKLETELKSEFKDFKNSTEEKLNNIIEKLDKLKETNIKNDGTIFGISKTIAILAGISGGLMAIIKFTIDILK